MVLCEHDTCTATAKINMMIDSLTYKQTAEASHEVDGDATTGNPTGAAAVDEGVGCIAECCD